ncbi:restriction endonuclease subunit S [Vibrio cholerae]|uniref:restriction endonuclease subunit S n=1 Tax=Vibrio cholerae TaxID=666 RepID=UPI00226DB07F|nr:restriction endonuclease subunit S [Vibrio cholerae]MCX9514361.1 restriction endonuclease subunit S [Vibrio cholerae]MCX9517796.1 restriction endonuclease subunit S [Vibrio cholerae]
MSVPNGWTIRSLGDLGRWSGGGTPSKAITEYWENGTIPWVSPKDMGSDRISITEDYITPSAVDNSSTKLYPAGSVLVVTRSGILRRKVPVALALVPVAVNQDIKVLPSSKAISTEYVANFMWCYNETILARCAKDGTTVESIDTTSLLGFPIKLPPLPEQKKIAQILSTWDKAITTTEQLLANSQQQKKALMQQLLTGKKRLLDKNGVRFSGEWKFQSISQISKRIQRKSDGEDHPILTISSLSGFVRQDERYSRYMAGESVKNYILLKKGEFAYNKGNSKTYEFGCIFDLDSYKSGLVPHVYVCFKLHQGLSHRYFKYLFEADYLKPQLGALVNTGVRNNGLLNIKPAEFMNTKVPVPCFDEQEQIADVLHASSETINKLQLKLDALKQEKKALMQQLLTGKRRVLVS